MTDLRHNSRLLCSVENSIKNGVTNSRFYSVTHAAEGQLILLNNVTKGHKNFVLN